MSRRFATYGGVAALGGVTYYLYNAGGDPKLAEKKAERKFCRGRLPGLSTNSCRRCCDCRTQAKRRLPWPGQGSKEGWRGGLRGSPRQRTAIRMFNAIPSMLLVAVY